MRSRRPRSRFRATLALLIGLPSAALAQVAAAPDITVDLSGVVVRDHQVAIDDLAGTILLETFLGSLPDGAEVDAYHDEGPGGVLFSVDTAVSLPGGVFAGSEDVVRLDGGVFTLVFDGSAEGVPAGAGVDAVTRSIGKLVLSFDKTVTLDGVTFEDEDLASFTGGVFTLAFDASAAGVDRALDTDGVASIGAGVWALSFDGHGALGGVAFADEDVVRVDTSGPTFALLFDASAEHAGWADADLGALPEPGLAASLLSGAAALAALATRRRAKTRRPREGQGVSAMRIAAGLMLIAGVIAPSAKAVDGVLEIDQTCGSGAGCFAGDTAGFPVQITTGGSYRLTTNLAPPNQNTDVISISVTGGVSVDLNGFAIQGTNTFAGTGLPGACSAPGTGVGVRSSGASVALSNGHVRGMGSHGVALGGDSRVERLIAEQNCGHGVSVSSASLVSDTVARRNRGAGIRVGPSSRVQNCTAEFNFLTGISSPSGAVSVEGCLANSNGNNGISGVEVVGAIASLVLSSETNNNGNHGIVVAERSLVLRSSTNSNPGQGISLGAEDHSGVGFITANGNSLPFAGPVVELACSQFDGVQSCP